MEKEKDRTRAREASKRYREKHKEQAREAIRLWQKNNSEKVKATSKRWREAHKDEFEFKEQCKKSFQKTYYKDPKKNYAASKRWRESHVEQYKDTKKQWDEKHKDEQLEKSRLWRQENLEKSRKIGREWNAKKRIQDPGFRILASLRSRIRIVLRRHEAVKAEHTKELLGCDAKQLREHLEKAFREGMTWENYGSVWHVDHIRPCVSFDLTQKEEQKACFHYSNLQPLFVKDNIKKSSYHNGKKIYRRQIQV